MLLVQPLQRNYTDIRYSSTKSPCGGYPKSDSHLISSPGTATMVQWRTIIPRDNGTCRIRISQGNVDGEIRD